MKLYSKLFFLFVIFKLWIFCYPGFSQQVLIDNFTISNGLPSNNIYSICGDEMGYLWLGTDNGVIKFDGERFIKISGRNQSFSYDVFSIKIISASNVWIGFRDGRVARFNGDALEFIIDNNNSKNANLFIDSSSRLWIATEGSGVYMISNPEEHFSPNLKLIHYQNEHNMPDDVFSVCEDVSHRLWFLTQPGIKMFDKNVERFIFYRPLNLPRFTYYCMLADSSGIYLGADHGIVILNQHVDSEKEITVFEGPPYEQITSISRTSNEEYWFGTKNQGILRFHHGKFKKFDMQIGLSGNKIKCIYTDHEDNVWIGHFENGLSGYKGSVFTRFNNFPEVGRASVYSLLYNNESKELWIGTDKGLFIGKNNAYHFEVTGITNLRNIPILSIVRIDNKTIAVGTYGEGLILLKDNKVVKTYNRDRDDGLINKLAIISKEKILVAHSEGLYSINFRNSTKQVYKELLGIEVNDVNVVDENTFLIGTAGQGLFIYTDGNISKFNDSVLLGQNILCLYNRKLEFGVSKITLIGTENSGVYSVLSEGKKIKQFLSGYSIDRASFLTEFGNKLWIGTNKGIISYDNNSATTTVYDQNSGFSNVEIKPGATCFTNDSILVFGTSEGLCFLNPNEFRKTLNPPLLNIEQSFANDSMVITNGIELPYSENNILFNISAVSLSNPYSVNTQYRLVGLYDNWLPVNDNMQIRFQKLPPGNYQLYLRSSTNESFANYSESKFKFSVLSPFWQTIPFYSAVVLMIIALGFLFYRVKLKRALEKQFKKHENELKLAELELKSFRSQMNPHFIFNSLQSIQNYINESKADDANDYLVKFSKLMRLILENSINDTVPLEDDLNALELYMQLESARLVFPFSYEIKIDDDVDSGSIFIPPLLIQPFVENAIWHGLLPKQTPGMIKIIFSFRNNNLHCIIEDNGVGRKSNKGDGNVLKKKSLGVKITRDRLALQSVRLKTEWGVHFTDLFDEQNLPSGTRVELLIPVEI